MDVSLSELRELVMDREALACCDSWGRKELDMTEWLNWTELSAEELMFLNCGAGENQLCWAPKSLQIMIATMKWKDAYSLEGKLWPT